MSTAKMIPEQREAKRIRSVDFRTVIGARIQFVGIDGPPTTAASNAKTIGVVALPTPAPVSPTLAEVIAEHVVERLHAMGASVTVTGAHVTSPTVTGTTVSAPAPLPATGTELNEPPPILLTTTAAAKLLGCSVKALYHRVAERQVPSSCIVRSGRRILFHRTRLLEAMERRAGR